MKTARVCRAGAGASSRLVVAFPIKCMHEVLHVFQTRFALHAELYQHRVGGAIDLMLRDALRLADTSDALRIYTGDAHPSLRLSECGGAADASLEGFLQLDDSVTRLVRREAHRAAALDPSGGGGDTRLASAAALLDRIDRRHLYRFVGSVIIPPAGMPLGWQSERGLAAICEEVAQIAVAMAGGDEGVAAAAAGAAQAAEAVGAVKVAEAEQLAELASAQHSEEFGAELLRADVRHVHYGRRAANPLAAIQFFDNKQRMRGAAAVADGATSGSHGAVTLLQARPQPAANYDALLPIAFEEVSLRLFLTSTSTSGAGSLDAVRWAFASWCERQGLCGDDVCQVDVQLEGLAQ